jgi:sporulation protein YlmC with PRC-barrel domain
MTPHSPIKLVSELLDLPLYDTQGKYCGIVDDVEFSGEPGKALELKALLVGPGAYAGRLPRWAMWLVEKVAGHRITRVAMDKIQTIDATVHLKCAAAELGLDKSEAAAARWIPHWGAL